MSKNHKQHAEKKVAVVEPIEKIDTVVEDPTPVEPEAEPATEIIGFVSNCERLNIRKESNINAKVVQVVDANNQLAINLEKSTDEWFHVCTEIGTEGFCMKKYVTVNQ
jgi:uncharacterized protein YgiM (DUF1202 family)